jgi:hypothetical protein
MQGFQAKAVAAVRSQRVVCVVKVSELRAKAFQIGFDKDGSLFIHFPYFQHRTGILSSSEIPATGERKADVNIEHGGKVTSHRVKYSHHPDGRAHFSQDGRIFTVIKRQSISLDTQNGHMFTLYIQGLYALEVAKTAKDAEGISVECHLRPLSCCKASVIAYFHGGNTGSNPVGDAKSFQKFKSAGSFFRRHGADEVLRGRPRQIPLDNKHSRTNVP